MILKRPSFRRGGNSGIATLRQRYARGTNQNFFNPGKPQDIADFYKEKADKMKETQEFLGGFLKGKPMGPGTFRGYKVPDQQQPPVIAETIIDDDFEVSGGVTTPRPGESSLDAILRVTGKEQEKPETNVKNNDSSISLDPKEEIAKEAEFIKELLENENLTRGENALILAKAIGTPGSISEKISKAADLAIPVVKQRDKQDKAVTLKAYELFKKKEAEQAKRDAPTPSEKDIGRVADALIKQGDTRPREEIISSVTIKAAGLNKEGLSMLSKGGGEVLELVDDIRKERAKLKIARGKKKPNEKTIENINREILELQAQLGAIAAIPGFDDIFVGFRKQYLAEGGRTGFALGTPEEEVKITETIADTPGAPTPERQVLKLSYAELRNKLPKEISDDVVELLANSTEALQDFAYITTQDDVGNFNVKYGVNLVIPQTA